MDAATLLRNQLQGAHEWLESTVGDAQADHLHYPPQGRALPACAAYAHVIFSEDIIVQVMLKGGTAIFMEPDVETGASEPMPDFSRGDWDGYADWTKRVRIDLPAMRRYAQRVYAASDAYLASLSSTDLDGDLDLSRFGWGSDNLARFISRGIIAHADNLAGEISAAKGLQGLKGYPI